MPSLTLKLWFCKRSSFVSQKKIKQHVTGRLKPGLLGPSNTSQFSSRITTLTSNTIQVKDGPS